MALQTAIVLFGHLAENVGGVQRYGQCMPAKQLLGIVGVFVIGKHD